MEKKLLTDKAKFGSAKKINHSIWLIWLINQPDQPYQKKILFKNISLSNIAVVAAYFHSRHKNQKCDLSLITRFFLGSKFFEHEFAIVNYDY